MARSDGAPKRAGSSFRAPAGPETSSPRACPSCNGHRARRPAVRASGTSGGPPFPSADAEKRLKDTPDAGPDGYVAGAVLDV